MLRRNDPFAERLEKIDAEVRDQLGEFGKRAWRVAKRAMHLRRKHQLEQGHLDGAGAVGGRLALENHDVARAVLGERSDVERRAGLAWRQDRRRGGRRDHGLQCLTFLVDRPVSGVREPAANAFDRCLGGQLALEVVPILLPDAETCAVGRPLEIGVDEIHRKVLAPGIDFGRPVVINRKCDTDRLFIEDGYLAPLYQLGLDNDVDEIVMFAMRHRLDPAVDGVNRTCEIADQGLGARAARFG